MIFQFLKYVKPAWYFLLRPAQDHCYFSPPEEVKRFQPDLLLDQAYVSKTSAEFDLAWRALMAGCVSRVGSNGLDVWRNQSVPLEDEYRFLRKYFSSAWSLYVLFLRLLHFHNPVAELYAYWKSRSAPRIGMVRSSHIADEYDTFESPLVARASLVTVIIPTLNRYKYLHNVLLDLEAQTYRNFEVLIVDQSDNFRPSFYEKWSLSIHVWHQPEKALWKARNDAIRNSRGEYLLFYDDDSRVGPDWIAQHLRTVDFFNSEISAGESISQVGDKVPDNYGYFRWSDQLDTGNVMIHKKVFDKIGLFDRQFERQRMGDGEFGLRAYLAGFRNINNPRARRLHLKVGEGGLRQMGNWDAWRPKKWWSPRPIPSVLYFVRKYFGDKPAVRLILANVIPSVIPYRFKASRGWLMITPIFFLIVSPLLMIQVARSWSRSGKMLKEGAKIDHLEHKADRILENSCS